MADLTHHPGLQDFVLPNVRFTGNKIGAGAYGSVEEVEILGARCAAKKIFDFFLDPSEIPAAEIQRSASRFVEECQLMSTLRHPHIVQFLGVCFLPDSQLPALVMELLLTNVHDLLDPETGSQTKFRLPKPDFKPYLPLGLKHSILHDVASGLAYLHNHTPVIIHRDLSARNVLLNSAMVAKIADLGMARILPSAAQRAATMTKAPGAPVYMPPEACDDESRYDATIDIFSLGVVAMFTISQTFPCNLLAATYTDQKRKLLARSELERRGEYMQQVISRLSSGHPLVLMIKQCLENFPGDRPNIHQVLQFLEQARAEIWEDGSGLNKLELLWSVQEKDELDGVRKDVPCSAVEENRASQMKDKLLQMLTLKDKQIQAQQVLVQSQQKEMAHLKEQEKELESSRRETAELQRQLQVSKTLLAKEVREKASLAQELQRKSVELEMEKNKEQQIVDKDAQLARIQEANRRSVSQLHGQLQAQEEELKQLKQKDQSSRMEVARLQQQLQSSEALLAEFLESESKSKVSTSRPSAKPGKPGSGFSPRSQPTAFVSTARQHQMLKFQWQAHKKAPQKMSRGAAAADEKFMYFVPADSNIVYRYGVDADKWQKFLQCPFRNSGLLVFHGALTTVGGWDGQRQYTAENFSLKKSWIGAEWVGEFPPMRFPRSRPAVAVALGAHQSSIIAIGGRNSSGPTSVVEVLNTHTMTWSMVTNLPDPLRLITAVVCEDQLYVIGNNGCGFSCALQPLISAIQAQSALPTLVWMSLPPLPVSHATAATLCGQLVAIGGLRDKASNSLIRQLVNRQWVNVGSLHNGRYLCLAVSPSPHKLVVVGGYEEFHNAPKAAIDSVEVGFVEKSRRAF